MNRVGLFEKVSFNTFFRDLKELTNIEDEEKAKDIYKRISLPQRATKGSAGYDFFMPFWIELNPNESVIIPTGIRCYMLEDWVLSLFPRSGLGFKYRMQLDNTCGIIDSDYYYSSNEGHIMVKITNDTRDNKILTLDCNDRFVQAIFHPFGITFNDEINNIRNGGFGSTGA